MTVLGIDPGTTRAGFGIIKIEGSQYKTLAYGLLSEEKILIASSLEKRLHLIHKNLVDIIKEFKPDKIGVEALFFAKNVKTAFSVAYMRGIILMCCGEYDIPLFEPTPLQVKKGVTGHTKVNKSQVEYMACKILGLANAPKPDDVTDALAVAITTANFNSFNTAR